MGLSGNQAGGTTGVRHPSERPGRTHVGMHQTWWTSGMSVVLTDRTRRWQNGVWSILRVRGWSRAGHVDRKTILDRLKAESARLRKRYGLKSLAVFGSMARGDDREGSDVDILVTFDGRATFDAFMGLKLDLEDLLGRPVDLGTPETLRPELRAEVERDLIHVP